MSDLMVENRIRFLAEVIDAIAAAVGPERTACRISPWSSFQAMKMIDPVPTFTALVEHLVKYQPRLAYLHVVERRVDGIDDIVVQVLGTDICESLSKYAPNVY